MSVIQTAPEIARLPLAELEHASYNPREITPEAMSGLLESLGNLGLLELPVVNVRDGKKRIVSGHQRVTGLLQKGVTHADCVLVRFDDAAEMSANLSMNNSMIRGTFDPKVAIPTLDALMTALPTPGYMGFDRLAQELHAQADRMSAGQTKAENSGATVDEKAPSSVVGVVYALGKHRLLCGSFEDTARLLAKKALPIDACVTDPPYNVSYEQVTTGETLANDDLDAEAWRAFLTSLCRVILKYTKGPSYVFMSSKEVPALQTAWEESGGVMHRLLFWSKDRFTLGRGDYHHQHEPIMYGARTGSVFIRSQGPPRTNVLEFPKPVTNDLHPTQKPVELIRALVEDATGEGGVVFDPFAGSGTVMAVAEELHRICYACELSPKHCDTIRRRVAEQVHGPGCDWESLTPPLGKKG